MWLDYKLFLTLDAVRNDLANILINPLMFLSAKCYSCAARLLIMWVRGGAFVEGFFMCVCGFLFCLIICFVFFLLLLFCFSPGEISCFKDVTLNKGICQFIRNIYVCFQTPNHIFLLKRSLELYLYTRISACVHVVPS